LWADLKKATSSGKSLTIGLFHSGTGQVYLAEIQDVIGPGFADERVRVPEGEENLIPDYYRKSPFSRAWLRITNIGLEPIQFFGNYSFASVPQIPNYSEAVLKSLQNKVIVDAQELRSMDTTVWEVRRKVSGDSTQTVLLTTRSIGKAISREPVETQSNVVVHITDPHFATGDHRGVHVWRLEASRTLAGQPSRKPSPMLSTAGASDWSSSPETSRSPERKVSTSRPRPFSGGSLESGPSIWIDSSSFRGITTFSGRRA
jgi:hypothetical protein